jgi:hypothetical protein
MNDDLMNQLQGNPQLQQAVAQAVQELSSDPEATPQAVAQLIRMFEFTLQHPESYAEMRASAIQSGVLDPEDLPEQFQPEIMTAVLIALKLVQQQLQQGGAQPETPAFARGGLNQIAAAGRGGDTRLAHINPFEDRLLRAYGGTGAVNPRTGLQEYGLGSFLKKAFKAVAPVLPIALSVMMPGVGTALGSALGASGMGASMLGNALIGGLSSKAAGGDWRQGSLMGGLGGALSGAAGSAANNALGLGLGQPAQAVLGSGLVGGATSALTGGNFVKGAAQGALAQYAGQQMAGAAPTGANTSLTQPGATEAPRGYGGEDLGSGLKSPSASVVESLRAPAVNTNSFSQAGVNTYTPSGTPAFQGPESLGADYSLNAPTAQAAQSLTAPDMPQAQAPTAQGAPQGLNLSLGAMQGAGALMGLLGAAKTPAQVQQVAAQQMSPEQKELWNRAVPRWDWGKLSADASAQGLDLGAYVAQNWDKLSGGGYDQPVAKARGGALNMMRLYAGGGSGRDDTIDAKLSDGEYVMDAETVAMLGDGSTKEGARRLDAMRSNLRTHKGKALAKGKFSPNAKSPLSYLKEAA